MSRSEFSRPLRVVAIPREITVEADEHERAALALRMDLIAVQRLICTFRLIPQAGGRFAAEGHLAAQVEQLCIVTLEPFSAVVTEDFSLRFVPAGSESSDSDPAAPDEIPYDGDQIDFGEAAAEQLALALDPYPRGPEAGDAATAPLAPVETPFAALARFRRDH